MRDEVFLDNQLYYQGAQMVERSDPGRQDLKIVESFEKIPLLEETRNPDDEMANDLEPVAEVEDPGDEDFYEAMPLIEENEAPGGASIESDGVKDQVFEPIKEEEAPSKESNEHPIESPASSIPENVKPASTGSTNVLPPIDPFVLVLSASASQPDPFLPERQRPLSPRELHDTLEEIKHNFRAQLEPEGSVSASPSPLLRPKASHGKGRAPPPPLPPKRHSLSPQPDAISQTSTGSLERKPGIGQLLKNIKANVLRNKANPSQQPQPQPEPAAEDEQLAARETQI